MEWKRVQLFGLSLTVLVIIAQVTAFPSSNSAAAAANIPEDYEPYEQGVRELMEELERQGGLTAPMVPRAYYAPNHKMTRKSQRSNSLRLRFGKRSAEEVAGIGLGPALGTQSWKGSKDD